MTMVYRAWINVPGLPVEQEDVWLPVIEHLERHPDDFGAVIGWESADVAQFVMSTSSTGEADAAQVMFDAVCVALGEHGPAGSYPTSIEVETVVTAVDLGTAFSALVVTRALSCAA